MNILISNDDGAFTQGNLVMVQAYEGNIEDKYIELKHGSNYYDKDSFNENIRNTNWVDSIGRCHPANKNETYRYHS